MKYDNNISIKYKEVQKKKREMYTKQPGCCRVDRNGKEQYTRGRKITKDFFGLRSCYFLGECLRQNEDNLTA